MRVAVVTPYAGEPLALLRRAHDSVRAQTHPVTHVIVADSAGRPGIGEWAAEHIVLGRPHHDGGCAPRAIGALSAFASGHDAVAFLDADNYYAPEHVATLVDTVCRTGASLAFSDRSITLADGTLCLFEDRDVVERRHADTSCHFLTARAAFLTATWGMMGATLWPLCDRIVLAVARRRGVALAWTGCPTVTYTSHWGLHYKAMGKPVPCDEHQLDWSSVRLEASKVLLDMPWLKREDILAALDSEHASADPDGPIEERVVHRAWQRTA